MSNVRIAIAYYSGRQHTAKLAEAVRDGAAGVAGTAVDLIFVNGSDTPWATFAAADAIIFGTPTYMGGPAAAFKAFQEATSKDIFADGLKWRDKIAAGFTNSASRSGDKLATLMQLAIFAAQHGMHWVNLGLLPGNHASTGSEDELNRLGFFMGAAAQSNSDESADVTPPSSDLRTARHLGARVAAVTHQFVRGRS